MIHFFLTLVLDWFTIGFVLNLYFIRVNCRSLDDFMKHFETIVMVSISGPVYLVHGALLAIEEEIAPRDLPVSKQAASWIEILQEREIGSLNSQLYEAQQENEELKLRMVYDPSTHYLVSNDIEFCHVCPESGLVDEPKKNKKKKKSKKSRS